jgi:hypothetical protein
MSRTIGNATDQMVKAIIMEDEQTVKQLLKIKNEFVLSTFSRVRNHSNHHHPYHQQQQQQQRVSQVKPSNVFTFSIDPYINEPRNVGQ